MSSERPDFSIKPHVLFYLKAQQAVHAETLFFWFLALAVCLVGHNIFGMLPEKPSLKTADLFFSYSQILLAIFYTNLRLLMAFCLALTMAGLYAFLLQKNKILHSLLAFLNNIAQTIPSSGFFFLIALILNYTSSNSYWSYGSVVFVTLSVMLMWRFVDGFQQAQKLLANDIKVLSQILRLTSWQRFWAIDCPHAIPFLTVAAKRSMADAWFTLIFMEGFSAIINAVEPLEGIGLVAVMAAQQENIFVLCFIGGAILVSLTLQNQLLLFPLSAWSTRHHAAPKYLEAGKEPWLLKGLRRSALFESIATTQRVIWRKFSLFNIGKINSNYIQVQDRKGIKVSKKNFLFFQFSMVIFICFIILFFEKKGFLLNLGNILSLLSISMLRVWAALLSATFIWGAVGIYVGQNSTAARWVVRGVRYASVFPFNVFYPVCAFAWISLHLHAAKWTFLVLALGVQWTVFLSVVEGMQNFPPDILDMRKNLKIRGILFLRKIILPGILPYYLMGIIGASSMAWNATIAAEVIPWGHVMLSTNGIGSFIVDALKNGDKISVLSGVIVIAIVIEMTNLFVWRPLARYALRAFATTDKAL